MLKLYVSCFALLFMSNVFASNITLSLPENLPEDVEHNIRAYLGDLPTSEQSRTSFLYSAKSNTIKALQALGYYQSVVDTRLQKSSNDDKPWTFSVNIQLNAPTLVHTMNVNITGDAQHDEAFNALISKLPLKPNEPLHHGYYQQLKSNMLSLGLQRGYFDGEFTTAEIAITPENLANITLHYASGERYKFGKVHYVNDVVEHKFIQKLVPFKAGEYYQVSTLQQFQSNLEKTQYFSNILIVPNKSNVDSKNKQVPIEVTLEQAKKHYFDIGLGYATDTNFRVSAGWKTPLVNQYGHRQETLIKYSKINPTGRFKYSIPINGELNHTLQLKLLLENDEYGDIESNYWSSRISKIKTTESSNTEFYVRFLHEDWEFNNIADTADYFILGYSWSDAKRKGTLIDPSDGFSQYYNIEATHTDISSETSFVKFHAHWRYIKTLKPKHRLVTRAEVGYTLLDTSNVEEISPSLRFFAGGDQSIRGFSYQSVGPTRIQQRLGESDQALVIGGKRLAVASVEYQYYFTPKIRGALFADIGSAFDKGFKRSYSVGPGIHYISPIGAIKLDVGYSLSEESPSWRIHLNLGAEL